MMSFTLPLIKFTEEVLYSYLEAAGCPWALPERKRKGIMNYVHKAFPPFTSFLLGTDGTLSSYSGVVDNAHCLLLFTICTWK